MAKLAINGGEKTRTEPWPSWPVIDDSDRQALIDVLESGVWGVGGPQVGAMEREFAEFHDAKHAVATTSGTVALELALRAAEIGPGCEVIVPPYTFIATANAPIMVGAIPVFADIDPDTYCLDPAAAEAAITPSTRAIIGVHIAGSPCDMDALKAVADEHDLVFIEDAAQAHGAEWRGTKVGAIGHLGAFSFQSSKNVCAGEGGVVTTNDDELAARAWSIHNVGRVPEGQWYDHRVLGANLRITGFQAALIRCGLKRLPALMDRRDECGFYLQERLDEIPGISYATMYEEATCSSASTTKRPSTASRETGSSPRCAPRGFRCPAGITRFTGSRSSRRAGTRRRVRSPASSTKGRWTTRRSAARSPRGPVRPRAGG
jgi:dTDP-4-amino-4,6-dideoxygalactose transaminase